MTDTPPPPPETDMCSCAAYGRWELWRGPRHALTEHIVSRHLWRFEAFCTEIMSTAQGNKRRTAQQHLPKRACYWPSPLFLKKIPLIIHVIMEYVTTVKHRFLLM